MSKRSVVIFGGAGGGALVAQSIAALAASGQTIELLGYLNDSLPPGERISGVPVLGPFSSWRELPDEVAFLAPLHKAKEMLARTRVVAGLEIPKERWTSIVDPKSAVAPDAMIGHGCFVGPFATVGPAAKIGAHCVVRAGAHVSHDCLIGDFVFVGSNAVVCGSATVREGGYIAPNATIRDRCSVGSFAVVGLGAVVVENVPDFTVVTGTPARPIASLANI